MAPREAIRDRIEPQWRAYFIWGCRISQAKRRSYAETSTAGTCFRCRPVFSTIDTPLSTVANGVGTGEGHQGLTVPPGAFTQKHHGGLDYQGIVHMSKSVEDVVPSVVARPNLSLVIPYRKGKAKTTGEPLHTVATRDSAALVDASAIDIDDCRFRMLSPRERARAQRFPDSYRTTGNRSEQTMGFGNAVSSNIFQSLGGFVVRLLASGR